MDGAHEKRLRETTEDVARKTPRREAPRVFFHLEIPNKRRDCIVGEILANGDLRLPRVEMPVGFDYPDRNNEDDAETHIEARLGISGYLLQGGVRRVHAVDGVEEHHNFLIEMLSEESSVRKPLEWIHRDVARKSKWVPRHKDDDEGYVNNDVEAMFEGINVESSMRLDLGWETLGWFEKVTSWAHDVLEARNMVMHGRLRQIQNGVFSWVATCKVKKREADACVGAEEEVREEGCSETVFIKAGIPLSREARRTVTIGAVLGNIVPEVIAVDDKDGLMMQRNGGVITDGVFDQEALINTILKMQEVSMNRISELEAGGLRILDSEWIESNTTRMLKHRLLDGYGEAFNDDDGVADLRSCEEIIKKGCRKITNLGLPRTVVHGDLHLGHVGSPLNGGGKVYQLFDWGNSCIGNPLHDFERLLSGSGTSIDFPGLSIDRESAIRQVCKRWIPLATLKDAKLIFDVINMIFDVTRINALAEEYDDYSEDEENQRERVLLVFSDVMKTLNVMESLD